MSHQQMGRVFDPLIGATDKVGGFAIIGGTEGLL
jgi:hypothetical protein